MVSEQAQRRLANARLRWGVGLGLVLNLVFNLGAIASSVQALQPLKKLPPSTVAPPVYSCPAQIETLMPILLRDLPSYLNRSYLQFRLKGDKTLTYAQITSQPEFEPLSTGSAEFPEEPDPSLSQVFFTVLERQYEPVAPAQSTPAQAVGTQATPAQTVPLARGSRPDSGKRNLGNRPAGVTEWQNYHWLFLTRTDHGWQLALLYSRIGPYPAHPAQSLTPPRDSSQSVTAAALRGWLRDCQVGRIPPIGPLPSDPGPSPPTNPSPVPVSGPIP